MKLLAEHMDYLEQLGLSHKVIKSVQRGDYEEILQIAKTDIEYPCLWLETPDMIIVGDRDGYYPAYKGNMVVLYKADANDRKAVRYARHISQQTALDFMLRINNDQLSGRNRFTLTHKELMPLPPQLADYLIGWRFYYEMSYESRLCYDATAFSTSDIYVPVFQVVRISDTDITLTATPQNIQAGYTLEWTYIIDGGTPVVSTDNPLSLSEAGDNIYIEMKLTSGASVLTASAYILPVIHNVYSIPYAYNPSNE